MFCIMSFMVMLYDFCASVLVKSGLKTEITAVGDPPHWPCDTPQPAKVGGGRSVGIVRSRTKATELVS
jgi:hypothetical protein